jgi:hypothetical protein
MIQAPADRTLPDVFDTDRYRMLDDAAKSSASETREKIRAIFSGTTRIPASLRKTYDTLAATQTREHDDARAH